MEIKNILDIADISDFKNEIFENIINTKDLKNLKIERIISKGQISEKDFWYNQEENELVILLEGNAILEIENQGELKLTKGDYLILNKNVKHKINYTSKIPECIWLAIHYL